MNVRHSRHSTKRKSMVNSSHHAERGEKIKRSLPIRLARGAMFTVAALAYLFVSTSLLLFHGPYQSLKNYFIQSLDTTMHGYLLKPLSLWTLPESEIDKYKPNLGIRGPSALPTLVDYSNGTNGHSPTSIKMETIHKPTFTAYVMFISPPTRVEVAVTKYIGVRGETVSEFVNDTGAIAGINAGAFQDSHHWRGTGGIPLGITMHNGQLVHNDPSQWNDDPTIGITNKGQLIVGSYTVQQLRQMGVTQSVAFGPVLIQNGKPVYGINTWGVAPRTAIGQLRNGTMVFVVTDGRLVNGVNDLGASIAELRQLMLNLGCINAANLDGGSSATMVYNGKLINTPTDVLGERAVATAFVVMPN